MQLNQWHLVTIFVLLHGLKGTKVKLNNGGFEDIVLAINPELPEDPRIIGNIKAMVHEASSYLFNATKQRFYFKTVKIVIPLTWTPKPEYRRATKESYENADVIVAKPFLKYGDEPYTLQYGGCGEKGRYIHFTPNFLTNDSLLNVYGSRGRVFVHEWAHLRWGVFDEYNIDVPFYSSGKYEAEATRCSSDFTGEYIFRKDKGETRKCNIEQQTKLYESGCEFIPDTMQTTSASIMYMQSLSSITQFCDKSNHNIKAPNMQNKMCDYRSTWEVIMDSPDFGSSSPKSGSPPPPTISLLQRQERVLCLVLDVSSSMNGHNRINRLRQAATLFILQIIETNSWLGIVTFNSEASTEIDLQQITDDRVRQTLTSYLPTKADKGTNICSGVLAGFQVFLNKYSHTEGCEIVLLTDGEDSKVSSCFAKVEKSGAIIHTIALGPDAAKELEMLAEKTGGLTFFATDSMDSNGLIDAFSGISSGSGNISQQSIQLESKGKQLNPITWMIGNVSIDKTVGNDTFFVVTWNLSRNPPRIILIDPDGKQYTQSDFVIDKTNIQTARLKIPGTAKAGAWVYKIQNKHTEAQALSITVTTRAASESVPPVIVKCYLNRETNGYPNPMVIYAEVSQGFLPVVGASVTVTIESDSGKSVELELFDDGSGPDILRHDGIYSRYFTSFKVNGRHSIKVNVQGKDETARRVHRQNQVLYVPGYVENGELKLNPPRPHSSEDNSQANVGNFSRMTSGGSFVITGMPPGDPPDVFPPCKITDLEVELSKDNEFLLSWTAPGNDYDTGKAERYEIKMSENPFELRNTTFPNATSLNTSSLIPEFAGIKQSFQYNPENLTEHYGTSIYFAIRAIDDSDNVGEVSNIAGAVFLPVDIPSHSSDKHTPSCFVKTTLLLLLITKTIMLDLNYVLL